MFIPLKNTTHYSLLRGLSKPNKLISKAKSYGYKSIGLTDYGISGAIEFNLECKKTDIKPILGTKLRINHNNNFGLITLLAKNKNGWKNIIRLTSRSHDQDMIFDNIPCLTLSELAKYSKDLILLIGSPHSLISNLFCTPSFYMTTTRSEAKKYLIDSKRIEAIQYINILKNLFDNIYLEINDYKNTQLGYLELLDEIIVDLAQKTGLQTVSTVDTHYINDVDRYDQEVLLCSALKTTISDINIKQPEIHSFFKSDRFHLPNPNFFTNTEIFDEIESLCENYDITSKPKLPKFNCPNDLSELDYLRELARYGYSHKNNGWDKIIYGDRAKYELSVIEKANLAGYFLIVADYVKWAKSNGWMVGCGRGSAAGCLISYLIGITDVDPIPHNLLFERFYNEGRNSGDNIEYPDIDIDFPAEHRDKVIDYLRTKYGEDRVAQMVTFGRLQGRGALKEVLRVYKACDHETMNEITKNLPQEAEISDKLEESKEDSIIKWVLENEPKDLAEYCQIDNDGKIVGDYAAFFDQAIRIEGTLRSSGKHASGVVVAAEPLAEICPMINDKGSSNKITGYDMDGMKGVGAVKMDVLSTSVLDKIMTAKQLLI